MKKNPEGMIFLSVVSLDNRADIISAPADSLYKQRLN